MIVIEVDSQPVLDAFNRLIAAGQEPRTLLDAIGEEMEARVSNRFETKTDPAGSPWAPWKTSTVKSYPKSGANNRLLDRYSDMLGSLNRQVRRDPERIQQPPLRKRIGRKESRDCPCLHQREKPCEGALP